MDDFIKNKEFVVIFFIFKDMKDKHDKQDKKDQPTTHKGGHGSTDKSDKNSHHPHHDKHHSDKHHSDKHHPDKHHTLKGATINASPVNSSHPVGRHRSRSFTRKDTSHSVGSVKGHSHKDHDRGSASSTGDLQPEVKYENTYKMLPDFRFLESKVKEIMVSVFQENIKENLYDPSTMGQKCKLSSEIIKEKVKSLSMHRFKFICHVLAIQKGEQSMLITSRCLWDQRFDNFSTVNIQRGDYYIIGMVFAVYAE